MTRFQHIWRPILIVISAIHWLIFCGVFLRGVIDLFTPIIFVDYLYAAIYIVLGLFASLIFGMDIRLLLNVKKAKKRLKRWEDQQAKIFITSLVFLILYLFRFEFSSILYFAGYEIGRFFIMVALSGVNELINVEWMRPQVFVLAWIFQWHFLFAVLSIAESVGKSVAKKFLPS